MTKDPWPYPSDKTIAQLTQEGILKNYNGDMPSVWDMMTANGKTVGENFSEQRRQRIENAKDVASKHAPSKSMPDTGSQMSLFA